MFTVNVDNFEEAQQLASLKRFAARGVGETTLPALKDSPSRIQELGQQIADKVLRLLRSWIGDSQLTPAWQSFFNVLIYCVLFLAVAMILGALFIAIRNLLKRESDWLSLNPLPARATEESDEVAELLAAGHTKAAMRARWRLYLQSRGLAISSTPREILGTERSPHLDALMFAPQQPSREDVLAASRSLDLPPPEAHP